MSRKLTASGWPQAMAEPTEAPRDQSSSLFTLPLRRTLASDDAVLAVVFVDPGGECVDYCSTIDPYEAKVFGAQLQVTAREIVHFAKRLHAGRPARTEIVGEHRSFLLREVGEGYCVVVAVRGDSVVEAIQVAVEACIRDLRSEAGIETPAWDPACLLDVETRSARGWDFAPASFTENGQSYRVDAVMGRWLEGGGIGGGDIVCFRLRTEDGRELTLAFDETNGLWLRW